VDDERRIQKNVNLLNVIATADSIAAGNREDVEPQGKPSYEWFERWRENAENARNEDLKILWAKVMCKECSRQDSVSLRTLDFLKNLSKTEAKQIERISRLWGGGLIIRCFGNPLIEAPINTIPPGYEYSEFTELEESGVISNVNELGFTIRLNDHGDSLRSLFGIEFLKARIIITCEKKSNPFLMNGYKVNQIGKELFNIIDSAVDKSYLNNIVTELSRKGYHVNVEKFDA
jgi:hypothetical protein